MGEYEEDPFFVDLCVKVQDFYARITPEYETMDLIPENPYLFHAIPFVAVALYLFALQVLPGIQKKHNFFAKSKKLLYVFWNLFLSIYSLITFIYCLTWYVVEHYDKGSFWEVYCPKTNEYFHGPNVFWYYTFAISKFFELFDTILLIIRNPHRAPMFLHWYHHATVIFVTWWSFRAEFSPYFFGTLMNTFIHFNMYFYYALTYFFRPPWAVLLTVLQISQMIAGFVVYGSWLYDYIHKECYSDSPYLIVGYLLLIYTSYCLLFMQFFMKRYFGVGKKRRERRIKKE